ncbi:sorbitol dehydrogenase [Desulfuromonas versatilis]|uniref:Sorbitol dehydrogenase n=1 Tax=Desulfuromonas versatilis TaxID=2802975 RepID=A0ABN6E2B8_9BACT|nr:zinc-binding dehydrogenase [Desulfuromonas versatilis]BCR06322.1 sorbitol dehydrogenase [Desulfuromonas versatilis]
MKTYVLAAPGVIQCHEGPSPVPGPGELLLQVRAALTCGTDLKTWRRGHPKIPLPSPFGHEFSGTVAAVGEGVTAFGPGDAVMAVHTAPCGECFYCRAGQENLCESIMETKVLGAFAEQILLPAHIVARNVFHKPPQLSFEEAAFLEPLACVVYGCTVQPLRPEQTLVIIGAGPIGLLFLLLAKARGVKRVIVTGRREGRLELARRLGAELAINVDREDAIPRILQLTEGRGADQVIECTGRPEVWEATLQMVRKGGRVLLFGGCPSGTRVSFDTGRLHYDEITLDGVFHFTPAAVAEARELLVSGAIDVAPLISERLPLGRLEQALQRLQRGEGLKYALIPED